MPTAPTRGIPVPLRTLLTAVAVLAVAGVWLPAYWLWGVNHGSWLPRFAVPLGGLLALAAIWTPFGGALGRLWVGRVAPLVLERRLTAYGVVPIAGAALGWLLRDRTHLLGDGAMFGDFVARGSIVHGFDLMGFHLPVRIFQALDLTSEAEALGVFAAVSLAGGALHLAAAAWAARALGQSKAERALLHLLLVVTPGWFLFCGYVESYPLLAVMLLVYVVQLVRYTAGQVSYGRVVLAWSGACFWHLNALLLWPLLPLAAWLTVRDNRRALLRCWAWAVAAPLLTGLVIAGIYATSGHGSELVESALPRIAHDQGALVALTGRDGLLSLAHLKDVINLLLLLAAAPLALLAVGNWREAIRSGPATVLVLTGTLIWAALALVLHFKLGLVRDWDLLAPHTAVVVLAAVLVLRVRGADPAPLVGPVLAVGLLLTVPWLLVNSSEVRASARFEAVTEDVNSYARGLVLESLARRQRLAGDLDEAGRLYRLAADACPANPRFAGQLAAALFNGGDPVGARAAIARSLAADSTYAFALFHAARMDVARGKYDEALLHARRLAGRPEETVDAALVHGTAASATRHWDEAAAAYRRALARAPGRVDIVDHLGGALLMKGDVDGAIAAFNQVIAQRPDAYGSKVGLADALWRKWRAEPESAAPPPAMMRLLDEVIAAVAADPAVARSLPVSLEELQDWRRQITAVLQGE